MLTFYTEEKMLQVLNEDYLLNLCYRLDFEIELRTLAHSVENSDSWFQPMYLIPMWNIVTKIEAFKKYFVEFDIEFPRHMNRQPIDLSTTFPIHTIHSKEEEFVSNGEIIKIEYKYI